MVVRFDLDLERKGLGRPAIGPGIGVDHEALAYRSGDDRRVVVVGGQDAIRRAGIGIPDHAEQRQVLGLAVDPPVRVEYLVPAVFRVGLGKHHQLGIRRIAADGAKSVHQVVHLVAGDCQPQLPVGLLESRPTLGQHRHVDQRSGIMVCEQSVSRLEITQHRLRHAVVQHGCDRFAVCGFQPVNVKGDAALDARDRLQPAMVCNVRGLGRPGGLRTHTGHDQQKTLLLQGFGEYALQELFQGRDRLAAGFRVGLDEVHKPGLEIEIDAGCPLDTALEFAFAEIG